MTTIPELSKKCQEVISEVEKAIVGARAVLENIMTSVLAGGHVLIEDYPGLGKTLIAKSFATVLGLDFKRLQFTPDLLPGDITGGYVYNRSENRFDLRQGPIFANIILADEINRASPKTQSALLEAMQEGQVTLEGESFKLPDPFVVLATQNPIEYEGTFPLPEAQLDRFLLKIFMEYPSFDDELEIMERYTGHSEPWAERVISKEQVVALQQLCRDIPISEDLKKDAVKLVLATRSREGVQYGASPRASIGLILSSKARALLLGRNYVSQEDLHVMSYPILRHRIILSFESERRGLTPDQVISDILKDLKI